MADTNPFPTENPDCPVYGSFFGALGANVAMIFSG